MLDEDRLHETRGAIDYYLYVLQDENKKKKLTDSDFEQLQILHDDLHAASEIIFEEILKYKDENKN